MPWSFTLREEHRLFKNRVLRRIFCPKRDKVTEEWKRIHIKELYNLHSSLNIIQVIKSRRMSLAEHVTCIGRGEVHTGFWCGGLMERDHLEDLGVGGTKILKWILKKWDCSG